MRILTKADEVQLAKETMNACEQIIQEMGAELHDDLVQKLTVFRFSLDRLERTAADPIETIALIARLKSDFDDITQSVRAISRQLMPVSVEGDTFVHTIHMLCQNMERPGGAHIHFQCDGEERTIASFTKGYIYRIIQELIHNAFKHSSGWHIWVTLTWQSDALIVQVEDDGTGFTRISENLSLLKKKYNTLAMRTKAIGASIEFVRGEKGLLAKVQYPIPG